jgi:hypothetical protein
VESKRFLSTPGAFRDFKNSTIWRDMSLELNDALKGVRDSLECAENWESVIRLQECADVLKRMLVMPDVILTDLELDEAERNEGNGNG